MNACCFPPDTCTQENGQNHQVENTAPMPMNTLNFVNKNVINSNIFLRNISTKQLLLLY